MSIISKFISSITGKKETGSILIKPSETSNFPSGSTKALIPSGYNIQSTTTQGVQVVSSGGATSQVKTGSVGSGGGGGKSTSSSQPQVQFGTILTAPPGADVPASYQKPTYSGVISAAPIGITSGYSAAKQILADAPGYYKGKPIQKVYAAAKTFLLKSKQPAEEIVSKTEQKAIGLVESAYPSTGEIKRYETRVSTFNKNIKGLEGDISSFNQEVAKYPEGAPPGVYQNLKTREEQLNKKIGRATEEAEVLEKRGEEISKKEKGHSPEIISKGAMRGVVGLAFFFPNLIVAPVKIAKEQVTSLQQLPEALAEAPAPTIAGIVGSLAAGYMVGKVGGRILFGKQVDPVKLNSALKTAEVKPVSIKGKITESQIKAYDLPDPMTSNLKGQIKAGNSVRVVEYDIVASNSFNQKIINKGLPNRKIVSVDVVDTAGNIISRKTLVGIKVRKGVIQYKEYLTGKGAGEYIVETGRAELETTYVRGKAGKPALEIYKEFEVIKPQQSKYLQAPTGEIIRISKTKSITLEGLKRAATKEKPITFKDLTEVAASERRGFPVKKTSALEIQKIMGVEDWAAKIGVKLTAESPEKAIGFLGRDIQFKILKGAGKTERIAPPLEYEKVFSKSMKPFEEPKVKPTGVSGASQVLKQIQKQEFDVTQIPAKDFSTQISKSIQQIANKLQKKQPQVSMADLKQKSVNLQLQKSFEDTRLSSPQLEKLLQKEKDKVSAALSPRVISMVREKQMEAVIQTQPQIQSPKQIEKQIQKLAQVSPLVIQGPNIPRMDIPKVPFPIFPFGRKPGIGYQKQRKQPRKALKSLRGYTASLAAAAAQRIPVKITKAQLKKLGQRTYLGIEARPVVQLVEEKNLKKQLSKVEF